MTIDEKYMAQALKLARLGGRDVAPNPMVGAVIVKNGKVVGKGYHQKFGGPHAEINAIKSVKNPDELEGATMYVTLEPCRHYGKTPPCLETICNVGITNVICGSHDPFQAKLKTRNSKLEKDSKLQIPSSKTVLRFLKGSIAQECQELNKFYFTWVTKKRPYVTVKIAMSADGFVAKSDGTPAKFTNPKQDREVHQLRAQHQAIMVGINTVLTDDPRLTVRFGQGKDPLRIILDSKLQIPKKAKVLKDGNHLVATCRLRGKKRMSIWTSPTKKQVSLRELFAHLAKQGISSVLVEPGPTLYRSLKKQGLIDELIIYQSKKKFKQGLRISL